MLKVRSYSSVDIYYITFLFRWVFVSLFVSYYLDEDQKKKKKTPIIVNCFDAKVFLERNVHLLMVSV